ncbi:MAG: translesion error-prone DNA polymerase V autoproteolytic subunit [Bacteroidota bacterium]
MKKKTTAQKPVIEIFRPWQGKSLELDLYTTKISAGFPSPADDFLDRKLDLNEYLIRNPSATFLVRVDGNSMVNAGISDDDILIVDRSVEATDGKVVIGVIDGEFTVKRIIKKGKKLFLKPENEKFNPIEITGDMDFKIWGVVVYTIHKI